MGASFGAHEGQASVNVSRKAATATEPEYIYIYASCDSLQILCEEYERTIVSLRAANAALLQGEQSASQEERTERRNGALAIAVMAAIAAIAAIAVLRKK